MSLSPYEQIAWRAAQDAKVTSLAQVPRVRLPAAVVDKVAPLTERVGPAASKARALPPISKAADAYRAAASGASRATSDSALRTVSADAVLEKYRKAGHEVTSFADIRALDLKIIDEVAPFGAMRYRHAISAGVVGVGSAAAVTGATLLGTAGSVASAGAAAAPGIAATGLALAGDSAALLGLCARVVGQVGAYYGYDPRRNEEQLFVLSVVSLGMATSTTAKTAAYADLSTLTQSLAKGANWAKLNDHVLVGIMHRFAEKFALNLTKRKLGQVIPVLGMALGGGLNYATVQRMTTAAEQAYRERFLADKGGLIESVPQGQTPGERTGEDAALDAEVSEELVSVVQLVEEARSEQARAASVRPEASDDAAAGAPGASKKTGPHKTEPKKD